MDAEKDLKKDSPEEGRVGIATELLGELKMQNKRFMYIIVALIALIGLIVGGFLTYLWQYDFSSSIDQTGVYALIDSDGNVIGSDITPEQMEDILRIINGDSEGNEKAN